jgi:hypothetical protein
MDAHAEVVDSIEVLRVKLDRVDKIVTSYDEITVATDQKRKLALIEKEIKQSSQ